MSITKIDAITIKFVSIKVHLNLDMDLLALSSNFRVVYNTAKLAFDEREELD